MRAGYVFGSQTLVVCDVVALSLGVTAADLTLAHLFAVFVLHSLVRIQRTRVSSVSDRFVPAVDVLDRQVFLGSRVFFAYLSQVFAFAALNIMCRHQVLYVFFSYLMWFPADIFRVHGISVELQHRRCYHLG
jgi:hypothetical protein